MAHSPGSSPPHWTRGTNPSGSRPQLRPLPDRRKEPK
jgi:hypothetical protein